MDKNIKLYRNTLKKHLNNQELYHDHELKDLIV